MASPRSLDQILSELNPIYDPQIKSIKARQAELPGQLQAEEQGLQAKQTQAFDDILGGARRRGLGFSGIPLGEQARYTATDYLPALARLRATGREQQMSLEDAIFGIQERRGTFAQQIRQAEEDRYAQELENERNRQAQLRAAQLSAPTLGNLGGGGTRPTGARGTDPIKAQNDKILQDAFNDVMGRSNQSQSAIRSDYNATLKSANYGNVRDKAKVQIYLKTFPWLAQAPGPAVLSPEFGQQLKSSAGNLIGGATSWIGNRISSNLGNLF